MTPKTCTKCHRPEGEVEFAVEKDRKGLPRKRGDCKSCRKDYLKKYYHANTEYFTNYRRANGARQSAKSVECHRRARVERRAETPYPGDKRRAPFPLPGLLGQVPDKELAERTGLSRAMVAWHRRKAGIVLNRQGERIAA